ncbi:SH3 domain-containing protein [Leptospira bandrabouensis]|uniref:SH3 domain-containing protein n=1 Tax=Leptospira bandrabouensis TaxID=2484903 RepID=UPI001EEAFBEE|nr:SH3 domain-containing protein [Leptospira bandrabouensis]MCG6154156.1 SH3 domain-containing protein [Leptospira bandrabouensis]
MFKFLLISTLFISFNSLKANDHYIPIAEKNINIYKEPTLNSEILTQLELGHIVKILPKKKIKDTVDKVEGFWIYVQTGYSINGWVFDYNLAMPTKFKRPSIWLYKDFNGCSGDYCLSLKMRENATYTYSYELCADGNCKKQSSCSDKLEKQIKHIGYIICEGNGIIKTYQNLVWLQHFGKESYEFLFIKDNKLCMSGMDNCID